MSIQKYSTRFKKVLSNHSVAPWTNRDVRYMRVVLCLHRNNNLIIFQGLTLKKINIHYYRSRLCGYLGVPYAEGHKVRCMAVLDLWFSAV